MGCSPKAAARGLLALALLAAGCGADLTKITACTWEQKGTQECDTVCLDLGTGSGHREVCRENLYENADNTCGLTMYYNSNNDGCKICDGDGTSGTLYTRHKIDICSTITSCSAGYEPSSDGQDCDPSPTPAPTATPQPTHPLVAHYSFDDGTAAEDSDGSLDGTISGATATTGRDGSGALSFDGTDDYVDFPAAVTADILGGAARTVCLWAKVDDLSGGDFLFGYGSENSYLAFGLQTGSTASDVFTVQFWNWYPDVEMPGSDDGDWHHYCLTYDGSDWTLYLDGSQAGTGAVAANTGTFNTLRLGHWYSVNYAIGYFSGAIDEVYVYSSALDAAAVQVLYDAVTPPPTPAPTPRPTRSCRTVQFSKHYLWNWGTPLRLVAAGAEAAGAEVDEVPAGAEVDEVPAGAEVDEVPAGAGADVRQPNRGEAAALRRVIRSILSAATHYEVLGVAPDAADAEISEVYRDLARTVHPDKPLGDAAAFRRLADAKSVLLDANGPATTPRSAAAALGPPPHLPGGAPSVAPPFEQGLGGALAA
ncbi:hypothetical protein JL722_12658 [Aureococcus anophagefferens]|nr:hypothetical protein JL722_12658 [Aureococcus anophagefferens]